MDDPSSNFAYHVLSSLQENPTKAFAIGQECIKYEDFLKHICSTIHVLKSKGLTRDQKVLVTIPPSLDFFKVALATFAIGCSVVIVSSKMGLERLDQCTGIARPDVWIWSKGSLLKYLKYLLPSYKSIPVKLELDLKNSSAPNKESASVPVSSNEISELITPAEHALVTFTSGSTGVPKLMMRRHDFILNQSRALSLMYKEGLQYMGRTAEESGEVFATNLATFMLHFLKVGASGIVNPDPVKCNPAEFVKLMVQHGASVLAGSPAFVQRLASYALQQNTTLPVKYTAVGGAPVYRKMLRKISAATSQGKMFVTYGSTEAEPISMIPAAERLRLEELQPDGHCVGRPLFKGSVKIIRILQDVPSQPLDVADLLELPCWESGEIIVSGCNVNTYQVEEERLVRDTDGTVWLRIGDAGYMDTDGRIWLVGRVKWRVVRYGVTYWSTVVEQKILDRCSLATFCTYISHNGEAYLFVEVAKNFPETEKDGIKSFLKREGIPADHLEFVDHIPRDARHGSKPDTAAIFKTSGSNPNSPSKVFKLFLRTNSLWAVLVVLLQVLLISALLLFIFLH